MKPYNGNKTSKHSYRIITVFHNYIGFNIQVQIIFKISKNYNKPKNKIIKKELLAPLTNEVPL